MNPQTHPEDTPRVDNLYIMCVETDPMGSQHGFKIGRAPCVDARANSLGTSMPFRIQVLVEYRGLGYLESNVHALLAQRRNDKGSGREWFYVSLSDAMHAIATVSNTHVTSS